MSKTLVLHNITGTSWTDATELSLDYSNRVELNQKHLYLFMIGGSGASLIEPLLFYFDKLVDEANHTIIPIFIDRSFHSEILSRSVRTIKHYQKYCAYSANKLISLNPFLFIDDNKSLLDGDNNLNKIINRITSQDTIAISYSLQNNNNIRVKNSLVNAIRNCSDARIFNLIFFPYFNLDFGDGEFLVSEDQTKRNLKAAQHLTANEHCFFVGLSKLSKYERSNYQRNPFNVVSLIHSYAVASYLSKTIAQNNSYYEYSVKLMPIYGLDDLIPGSTLRQTMIKNDFKTICWNTICQGNTLDSLQCKLETGAVAYINTYFDDSSLLIRQLEDKTIHQELQIHFRKERDVLFNQIWRYFSKTNWGIIKWKHSRQTFINELLSKIDRDLTTTSNMIIHETLKSIDYFITEHFDEINKLYY